jgi:putative DNA methylase
LFTTRQLVALGMLVGLSRAATSELAHEGYPGDWIEALRAFLACTIDRTAERNSGLCHYDVSRDSVAGTFQRYALPMNWDYCEAAPIGDSAGSYSGQIDWVALYVDHGLRALQTAPPPTVRAMSAIQVEGDGIDLILTDPPYYDAIPYSDLMDFFYVWDRRSLSGVSSKFDTAFANPTGPKWDREANDGELVDDAARHEGDNRKSKTAYEDGMARAFCAFKCVLSADGRFVVVFAHKHPDAWESLVAAIIRAGFVVDGSWPLQTEMGNRTRAMASAALASSVWLVCKKRSETARPGWDTKVLDEMRENIKQRLRDFWDVGIRGPDFVWAATGPALEAFSKHPVVKKADEPGQIMSVTEFLHHVRRIVEMLRI